MPFYTIVPTMPKELVIALAQIFYTFSALQLWTGQRSITANLWPLTAYIYHVMTIVTGGFSKKSFYYYFHYYYHYHYHYYYYYYY